MPALPEPDLSTQALTLQLTLENSWLPPELDEHPFLAALLASPQNQEMSRLSLRLEQNAQALRRAFRAYTVPPPARAAPLSCRLLPLSQYEPCRDQLARHQEQRRQYARELTALVQAALPPALLQANGLNPTDLPNLLHQQLTAQWTITPAPTEAQFLAAELSSHGWSRRLPLLPACRRKQAQARYRQALQDIQERAQSPRLPPQNWQKAPARQALQFRAYYLLPFLPGDNPMKAAARQVRRQANPYALAALLPKGDTQNPEPFRWIPKP